MFVNIFGFYFCPQISDAEVGGLWEKCSAAILESCRKFHRGKYVLPVVIFLLKIFVAFYRKRLCHLRILQKIATGCGEDYSFHHCRTMANINFSQIEKYHKGRGNVPFKDWISKPIRIGWEKRHLNVKNFTLENISLRRRKNLSRNCIGGIKITLSITELPCHIYSWEHQQKCHKNGEKL